MIDFDQTKLRKVFCCRPAANSSSGMSMISAIPGSSRSCLELEVRKPSRARSILYVSKAPVPARLRMSAGCGATPTFSRRWPDPEHTEQHDDFKEWCGGEFDAEAFDAEAATRAMRTGLPNWRG